MAAPIKVHAICCRFLKSSLRRYAGGLSYSKRRYSKSSVDNGERQTHFGYETVAEDEKEGKGRCSDYVEKIFCFEMSTAEQF